MQNSINNESGNIPNFRKVLEFDIDILDEMISELVSAETLQEAATAIDEIFIENTFTDLI